MIKRAQEHIKKQAHDSSASEAHLACWQMVIISMICTQVSDLSTWQKIYLACGAKSKLQL